MWELIASIDGHNRANGGEDRPEPPAGDDLDEMIARHADVIAKVQRAEAARASKRG